MTNDKKKITSKKVVSQEGTGKGNPEIDEVLKKDWTEQQVREAIIRDCKASIGFIRLILENEAVLQIVANTVHDQLNQAKKQILKQS